MQETALRGAPRAQNAEKSGAQKPTAPAETLVRACAMRETALRGAPRAQNAEKSGAQKPTAPAETLFRTFVMQETALRGAPRAQNAKKSDAQPRAKRLSAEKEFEHPKNMRAIPSARAFFSSRYHIPPHQKGHFFIRTRKAATEVVRSFFGKFLDKTRLRAA